MLISQKLKIYFQDTKPLGQPYGNFNSCNYKINHAQVSCLQIRVLAPPFVVRVELLILLNVIHLVDRMIDHVV